ncbi:GLPGLI family protein [Chryseobacterium carnipullorum]|uniref:GLPGLI family protein n=1 Tax=Chryseobacterium carnipullorum TaxID=1124835 RepID=A0A376ESS0_CHRCU|nr:GLPGLI family protein [Chryseobacterium carnipullorum]MDN5477401.1 GLPGLI family protein [Chryseobacterium sp.]AZA47901.1 GLPGLI family protein [Chryseobacterium carnipullorum]AZA67220.1 GLPGLI family protein [Chryseobacterium carnipullorum]MDN5481008.1 GLPGLI family protein [Chryseobacterium sp.]STD12657.1 GLPGLI family protein [Chryseobacterium carnipullorum]
MKKLFSVFFIALFAFASAQDSKESKETANRFFYELTFKPKKDSTKLDKVVTILDITDKNRSIYQDYTVIAQDSIMKIEMEAIQKSGMMKDLSKSLKTPKISARIYKSYPSMKVQYVDKIANGFTPSNIGYSEDLKFNWNILNDKQKIGEYNAQKATTEFGGRKWTAWFSTDLPFQDGPYKFFGLPGLIVKIEDDQKNYSWVLQGNKKVKDYTEYSYIENLMQAKGGKVNELTREKFEKTFSDFKKDPFASIRPMMTQEMMSKPIPGMDGTVGDMVKKQEKQYKDFYNANDNPIEISSQTPEKKKK